MIEIDIRLLRALRMLFLTPCSSSVLSLAGIRLGERSCLCAADSLFVSFSLSLFLFLLFPGHQGDFQ